jgi:hypothetical protein
MMYARHSVGSHDIRHSRLEERRASSPFESAQMRQLTKLACWKALAGKFILQTPLGTSLTCQNLIGFFGSIEGLPVLSHLDDTDLPDQWPQKTAKRFEISITRIQ